MTSGTCEFCHLLGTKGNAFPITLLTVCVLRRFPTKLLFLKDNFVVQHPEGGLGPTSGRSVQALLVSGREPEDLDIKDPKDPFLAQGQITMLRVRLLAWGAKPSSQSFWGR